ncbi:MAG: MmcQ/YjbR family DNA-binding protein [Ignavibacteriae bacterium]|nr:MmcQ/YjbR family DNA-binding protein [Ignavibacteriota bacterium]
MTLDAIRDYCLKKPGKITEGFPFGEGALVYKVNGKMFLLVMIDEKPLSMNLKADPEQAVEWREQYEAVQPGYHMNKKLWNTVTLDGSIPRQEIVKMIDHSYEQVVKGLKKTEREKILKQLTHSDI